ncbi:protein of unknown function [Streptantibioticus cattleyicolor NRRL 8057 = DSM 46488]|nr:protein of unknown function [Streptantibioticus cattleyicolor NRRL 8057 = DSM 46488]
MPSLSGTGPFAGLLPSHFDWVSVLGFQPWNKIS